MKRLFSLLLLLTLLLSFTSVSATRYLETIGAETGTTGEGEEVTSDDAKFPFDPNKDFDGAYPIDAVPGVRSDLLEGYTLEGEPVVMPDMTLYTTFAPEQITGFSDAIVDFKGWNAILGTTSYNMEENTLTLKVLESADYKTFGYENKMLGCQEYEFDMMIESTSDSFDAFLGLAPLNSICALPTWNSEVSGYLFTFFDAYIELQRYNPGQEIVLKIDNPIVDTNKWMRIKISIEKKSDTEKVITLWIDGEEILTYTDDKGDLTPDEGYFNILNYQTGDNLHLRAVNPTIAHTGDNNSTSITEITAFRAGENKVLEGGKAAAMDPDGIAIPFEEADRTMVPIRFLTESMGAYVSWDDVYQTATIAFDECTMQVTVGFPEFLVDGEYYQSDVPARLVGERLFVPVRALSEALGKTVTFEQGTVLISDGELTPEQITAAIAALDM